MRRQSRELALQILFQTEFTSSISTDDLLSLYEEAVSRDVLDYANILIHGVKENQNKIDELIQSISSHWSLNRMSIVDRNILRLAAFELRFASEKMKPNIAINEAVEIAKKFSTTESSSFVNGILDTLAKG